MTEILGFGHLNLFGGLGLGNWDFNALRLGPYLSDA